MERRSNIKYDHQGRVLCLRQHNFIHSTQEYVIEATPLLLGVDVISVGRLQICPSMAIAVIRWDVERTL